MFVDSIKFLEVCDRKVVWDVICFHSDTLDKVGCQNRSTSLRKKSPRFLGELRKLLIKTISAINELGEKRKTGFPQFIVPFFVPNSFTRTGSRLDLGYLVTLFIHNFPFINHFLKQVARKKGARIKFLCLLSRIRDYVVNEIHPLISSSVWQCPVSWSFRVWEIKK